MPSHEPDTHAFGKCLEPDRRRGSGGTPCLRGQRTGGKFAGRRSHTDHGGGGGCGQKTDLCDRYYSPAIVCWTLFFIFKWDWAWITATAYSAFWIGPGTPFFVISVTVTLAIKRFIQHLFGKKNPEADTETEKSTESSDAATDTVSENASTDASAEQTPTASEESTAAESESADQESFTTESESDGDNV